ncbi:MAG: helix-turn-helix domain-containing protein [Phycisphaerae bacterium]|nr:helix-turn-helix domain-containing protein [Phycisphaerae bacterium]
MSIASHREDPMADVTLLSVRQVADLLGVHARSVWRLSQTGDLPAPIRLSERVVRWRLSDLRDHLDRKAAGANGVGR